MSNWSSLSMTDRANIIRMAVSSGITDMNTIRDSYNSLLSNKFEGGGNMAPITTPIYARGSAVNMEAFNDITRRLRQVENNKDNPKGGYNKATNRWYPHNSAEGGDKTIGYGIKMSPSDYPALRRYVELAKQLGYLTDDLVNSALQEMTSEYFTATAQKYNEMTRDPLGFEKLSSKAQSILVDYYYNLGGLSKFPKLINGFKNGDMRQIMREYKRYGKVDGKRKELEARNKVIKEDLDSINAGFYPLFRANGGIINKFDGLSGPSRIERNAAASPDNTYAAPNPIEARDLLKELEMKQRFELAELEKRRLMMQAESRRVPQLSQGRSQQDTLVLKNRGIVHDDLTVDAAKRYRDFVANTAPLGVGIAPTDALLERNPSMVNAYAGSMGVNANMIGMAMPGMGEVMAPLFIGHSAADIGENGFNAGNTSGLMMGILPMLPKIPSTLKFRLPKKLNKIDLDGFLKTFEEWRLLSDPRLRTEPISNTPIEFNGGTYLDYGEIPTSDYIGLSVPEDVRKTFRFYDEDVAWRERAYEQADFIDPEKHMFKYPRHESTFGNTKVNLVRWIGGDDNVGGWANSLGISLVDNNHTKKAGLDYVLTHEGAHTDLFRRIGLPSLSRELSEGAYSPKQAKALNEAYDFTSDYLLEHNPDLLLEKGATNRDLRYLISRSNKEATREELNSIINTMSDDDILYTLSQGNGYARDFLRLIRASEKNPSEAARKIRTALITVPSLFGIVATGKSAINNSSSTYKRGGKLNKFLSGGNTSRLRNNYIYNGDYSQGIPIYDYIANPSLDFKFVVTDPYADDSSGISYMDLENLDGLTRVDTSGNKIPMVNLKNIDVYPSSKTRQASSKMLLMFPDLGLRRTMYEGIDAITDPMSNNKTELRRGSQADTVNRLYTAYRYAGSPSVRTTHIPFTSDKGGRAAYHPMSNSIVLPNPDIEDYLAELSHPIQSSLSNLNWALLNISDLIKYRLFNNEQEIYNIPDSFEYLTHNIVLPALRRYIKGTEKFKTALNPKHTNYVNNSTLLDRVKSYIDNLNHDRVNRINF